MAQLTSADMKSHQMLPEAVITHAEPYSSAVNFLALPTEERQTRESMPSGRPSALQGEAMAVGAGEVLLAAVGTELGFSLVGAVPWVGEALAGVGAAGLGWLPLLHPVANNVIPSAKTAMNLGAVVFINFFRGRRYS